MRPSEKVSLDKEVERAKQEMEERMAKRPKTSTDGKLTIMTDPRTGMPMARKERKGHWPDEV